MDRAPSPVSRTVRLHAKETVMKKISSVVALVSPAALTDLALAAIDGGAPPTTTGPARSNAVSGRQDQALGEPWNVRDQNTQGTPRSFGDVRNPVRIHETTTPKPSSAEFFGFTSR
jgi:hypothetical protein